MAIGFRMTAEDTAEVLAGQRDRGHGVAAVRTLP